MITQVLSEDFHCFGLLFKGLKVLGKKICNLNLLIQKFSWGINLLETEIPQTQKVIQAHFFWFQISI